VLSESQENYLKAIYSIIQRKNGVRVKDIAAMMDVKNSSVSSALKCLSESRMVNYEPYGIISLTEEGERVARSIAGKHRILSLFFANLLGIDRRHAGECACKIEHSMPPEVFARFLQFLKFVYVSHKNTQRWLDTFKDFCTRDEIDLENTESVKKYLSEIEGFLN
jgi:DtxR family Mn-dependent transcriptional regulator